MNTRFRGRSVTGASVNPARSIGPVLLGGDLSKLWIDLVAPIVGVAPNGI